MNQKFVNNKCKSIELEGNNEQNQPNEPKGENNDISQTQQKPNAEAEEEWNYFPDLCPLGFVGVNSPKGDCR